MNIMINPVSGLRNRPTRNPFQNAIPSFSIFVAVIAHAITQTRPTIANKSHAAIAAKCTCKYIANPPSFHACQVPRFRVD